MTLFNFYKKSDSCSSNKVNKCLKLSIKLIKTLNYHTCFCNIYTGEDNEYDKVWQSMDEACYLVNATVTTPYWILMDSQYVYVNRSKISKDGDDP